MISRSARFFFFGFFLFSFVGTVLPLPVTAAGLVPCGRSADDGATSGIDESKPCTVCHLVIGGKGVIDYGLQIMTYVAIAVIVAMAIFYIVSTGDEGMMQTAKSGIKAALIGFAVMLGAWLIVNTTLRILSASIPGLVIAPSGFTFSCDSSSSAGSGTGTAAGGTGGGNAASGVIVVPATGGTISVPTGSSVLFLSAAQITVSSAGLITQSNGTTQPVAAGSIFTVPAGATLSFPAGAATVTLPKGGEVKITASGNTAGGNSSSCPTGYNCESSCSGISGGVCNDGFGICCKPNTGGNTGGTGGENPTGGNSAGGNGNTGGSEGGSEGGVWNPN